MTFKSLDKLLNSSEQDPLESLIGRARRMDGLRAHLRQALPEIDPREIVGANCRDGNELVVVCRSSAWASRLRFESDRLLDAARRQGHDVTRCRVRVGR